MSRQKLTAMIPVYNEANRFLTRVLEHLDLWVDEIVVLDDCSEDNTAELCRKYAKVSLYENKKQMFKKSEASVRARLWELTVKHSPDWILAIDADEIFCDRIIDEIDFLLDQKFYDAIAFRFFDFWKSEEVYRVDGAWNSWQRPPSIFLCRYHPEWGANWPDSVIHSGRWPLEYRNISNVYFSDIRVKHLGWSRPEDHYRKFLFYCQKDLKQFGEIQTHTKSIMDTSDKIKLERWFERKRQFKSMRNGSDD